MKIKFKSKKNIKKVYKKIEDYFVDIEQLKRYKSNMLMPMEKIILTNNNTTSNLNLNLDNFGDARIIFENSAFNSFNIVNDVNNYSSLSLVNSSVNESNLILNTKSKIEISNSNIKQGKIIAGDINFDNFKLNNPLEVCNITLGNIHTKNINISNISQEDTSSIIFDVFGNNVKINNSKIVLKLNCSDISILNSEIILWKIEQIKNILLLNSFISTYIVQPKIMSCSSCSVENNSSIKDLVLIADFLHISRDSILSLDNSSINVQNLLLMGTNSKIEQNNTKDSLIEAKNIYLNTKANINVSNVNYINISNSCKKISSNLNKNSIKMLELTKNNNKQ